MISYMKLQELQVVKNQTKPKYEFLTVAAVADPGGFMGSIEPPSNNNIKKFKKIENASYNEL